MKIAKELVIEINKKLNQKIDINLIDQINELIKDKINKSKQQGGAGDIRIDLLDKNIITYKSFIDWMKNLASELEITKQISNLLRKIENNNLKLDTNIIKKEMNLLMVSLSVLLANSNIMKKIDIEKIYELISNIDSESFTRVLNILEKSAFILNNNDKIHL